MGSEGRKEREKKRGAFMEFDSSASSVIEGKKGKKKEGNKGDVATIFGDPL